MVGFQPTVATSRPPCTPVADVPRIVDTVADKASEWKALSLDDKIGLLQQVLENTVEYANEWTDLACASRGILPSTLDDSDNQAAAAAARQGHKQQGCARADVAISGVATFGSYLNGMIASLQHCRDHNGMPPPPRASRRVRTSTSSSKTTDDEHVIVTLWPKRGSMLQNLEAVGLRGELILKTDEQLCYTQNAVGGVVGILGAGNIDAPIELLCQMFLKGRVCIFKPNPVNEKQHYAVVLSKILAPLVERGYLDFVIGDGATVGEALVSNPRLDEVVLTGSAATYDKIKPLLMRGDAAATNTPICAELGGVNPWIIVPGQQWNRRSVDSHARHLAFSKVANNGHTCAAPQVFIVAKDWAWRGRFLERLRFWLGEYAGSPPFYPGSEESHALFGSLPNAQVVRGEGATDTFHGQQRPILIPDVTLDNQKHSTVFRKEAFCPALAEVPLDFPNAEEDAMAYLRSAVEFVNRECFGSLTANILIPDRQIKENTGELDKVIAEMPFGVVGVNLWPAFAHSMPMLVWGAPPGHSQSGIGFIGNAGLYKNPQKAVLRAPFQWIGRRALTIMSPTKSELVFSRLAKYKLRPNVLTQAMLFAALFIGI